LPGIFGQPFYFATVENTKTGICGAEIRVTMSLRRCILLLFVVISTAYTQQSPYFPRLGPKAVAQTIREIRNPASYLFIALAPGFEDLASIANIRIGRGASVAVAYVTNGEDIPSDLNGEMFYQLASRRKEEAYQALSYLGAQPYFLNTPINDFSIGGGCFHPTEKLDEALSSYLDSVIVQVKPDVLVLDCSPLMETKESLRIAYLERLIIHYLHQKRSERLRIVKRFFIQTKRRGKTVSIPVERDDVLWSKSYEAIAREAEGSYESLRYQIPVWKETSVHRYMQRYPVSVKTFASLDEGLPELGIKLKSLLPTIHSVFSIERYSNREKRLTKLSAVIEHVDAFIRGYEHQIDATDLRVLIAWKLDLEKLRCQIAGISVPYNVSDTVITPVQVFVLKFGTLGSAFNKGKTQILFPDVIQKQWIVNESQDTFYPLKDSSQFKILSPRSLKLNSTESPDGFRAMQVRTPFVFMVEHQDKDPDRNFVDREEIPLTIAPFRSVEVLTPQVMRYGDTQICVRFRSNVRDKTSGVFYVKDSLVTSEEKQVALEGKDFTVTDTLPLIWKNVPLAAPREIKILVGQGIPVGSFVVRPLAVTTDGEKRVAVCSAIDGSPLEVALRRLGVQMTIVDSTSSSMSSVFNSPVIIVDQFSFDKFSEIGRQSDSLEQWLKGGGTLIILPQYGTGQINSILGDDIAFTRWSAEDCGEQVTIDTTESVFDSPNKIARDGFSEKQFIISYCEISGGKNEDSKILMKADDRVLLLETTIGKGKIFYCGMNLFPRLLDLQKTTYQLLANLVSTGSH
jgi:hypothetical protein